MAGENDSIVGNTLSTSLFPCGKQLSPEWKTLRTADQRIYFYNLRTRSTHWFPPPEFWVTKLGLPYGWEAALDNQNNKYYVNHVTRITTREDPRSEADQAAHVHMTPPQARRIELVKDAIIGFGFVAGSEKPVVIRSVIPNGPSHDKLFANDQILKVNGEDVRDAAQADVIKLIKSSNGRIELEVVATEDVQDTKNQHQRKSSLMSRTTRERRRSIPVSVRFADEPALVQVIGPAEPVRRSSVPLIPNVLKVFLENGQTRSFRYDSTTTVEKIFNSFGPKLDVKSLEHFSLVLSGPKKGRISYIQNHEKVSQIYTNRNCSSVNCLCKLNIAFVPKDHFELLTQDPNTFEYLYAQVTNRVVEGFYGIDLKYDLAIKLAALHIQQKALEAAAGRPTKMSVRQTEREFGGLGKFLPSDHLDSRKEKDLRKTLEQQIKQNENLASPGEKHMSSLQCKIHYLNLASEIFSYGGRYFVVQLVGSGGEEPRLRKAERQRVTVLVSLKYGVSRVVRGKINVLCQLADFKEITGFSLCALGEGKRMLRMRLQEGKKIELICSSCDSLDLIALITGYYRLYVDNTSNSPLPVESEERWSFGFPRDPHRDDAPDFYSKHRVVPDVWSYPSRFQTSSAKKNAQADETKFFSGRAKDLFIDLSRAPPRFQEAAIPEESDDGDADASKVVLKFKNQGSANPEGEQPRFSLTKAKSDDIGSDRRDHADTLSDVPSEDEHLLDAASSLLSNSLAESDRVGIEPQSDCDTDGKMGDDRDEQLTLPKQRQGSSENLGTESWTVKSEHTLEDHEGLKSELGLAGEIFQIKDNDGEVNSQDNSNNEARITDNSGLATESDSWVFVDKKSTHPESNGDKKEQESLQSLESVISSESNEGQPQQTNASLKARISLDSTALLSSSVNSGQNTTEISRKRSIPARIKQDSLLTDNNVDIPKGSISEQENPHHLDPASLDGPFLNSDPCQDRSPSPSLVDLGFDESKFDNKGIMLSELTEVESNSVESGVGSGFSCTSMEGSEAGDTDSAVEGCQSQSQLREDGTLLSMQSNRVCDDSELPNEAVKASNHNEQWEEKNSNTSSDIERKECRPENENVESSESEEDSDDSDESDLGEQENGGSLWETFPEFFQPSSRHKYTGNKQGELCLFEEDDDKSDILSSTESDRNIVLVSHSKLGAKASQENVSTELVDRIQFGVAEDTIPVSEECEELSTDSDSSGDVEFVYEVNPDLSLESWTLNGEEGKNGIGCNDFETSCDQDTEMSFPVVLKASPDEYVNDCKISIVRFLNLKENGFEQSKLDQSNSTEETTSQAFSCKQNNIFSDVAPSDTSIENQNDLLENNIEKPIRTSGSDASLSSGKAGSVSLEGVRDALDRSYSPSDWIIPTPPTSTAELDDFDIHVVSPPPSSPDASDDDAFDDEIMDLMVPPPPSSCNRLQTLSGIKAVSPPPMDVKESETLDSSSGYIDTRFISLTDDHKLAQNKVLESKLLAHGNLMGQQKPPPQQADNDYSLLQREAENMNLSENQSGDRVFTKKSHLASKEYVEESCNLRRNNHSLYNQAFPSGATRFRFHKNQVSFSGSPSTVWSSEQTAVDVKSSCGATQTVNHQEDDLPRHDAVTETSFSRPAVSPKQKPSIPPKPLYTKTTNGQGWLEENKPVLTKATKFESPNTLVKSDYESMPQRLVKLEERRISRPSAVGVPICDTYSSDLTSFSVESVSTDFYVGESNPPDLVCKTQNDLKRSDEFVIGYCIDKKERNSDTEIDSRELCGAHIPAMPSTSFTQDTNPTKATSFGRTSPYVPTPYSPTRNLNRNQKNSALKEFESTRTKPLFSRSSCRESSSDILGTSQTSSNDTTNHRFTSSMHAASSQFAANNAGITGNSPDQRKIPLRHVTNSSSTSSLNVSSRLGSNSCDTFRILPEVPMECSNVEPHIIQSNSSRIRTTSGPLDNNSCVAYGGELPTIENTHVICRSHSPPSSPLPLPDSPPPPLPDSSPPKIFPRFDDVDFDFGEPQIEPTSVPCSNDTSPISHARHSVDMSSSLSDSKGKVSLQHSTVGLERSSRSCYGTVSSEAPLSSYRKHNSTKNIPYEISGNASSENLLSASLNLPSLPRVSSRRSLSEDQLFQSGIVRSASDCKRFSLSKKHFSSSDDDSSTILSTLSSDPESLKTKCSKVCKEALSTISVLNKKLETCLNGKAFNSQLPDETTKWPLVLQNSARFLACDVKIISSNVKRGSPQVVSALHTSLDSLGKLVESCEGAYITSGDRSRYDVRTLVVLVNEVLELFRDVVITVEAATGQPPEHPDVKVLADKTAAMATLMASLIRTLRKL